MGHRDKNRNLRTELLVKVLFAATLIGGETLVEKTWMGEHLLFASYEAVQRILIVQGLPENPDVVVVDIGQIGRRAPDEISGAREEQAVTDRSSLRKTVERIAAAGPAAIGIDVDLSPNADGSWSDPYNDPSFLEFLHGLSVPAFVGVYRARTAEPEAWLGTERYMGLAAGVSSPSGDARVFDLYNWYQWQDRPLCSMPALLASAVEGTNSLWVRDYCAPARPRGIDDGSGIQRLLDHGARVSSVPWFLKWAVSEFRPSSIQSDRSLEGAYVGRRFDAEHLFVDFASLLQIQDGAVRDLLDPSISSAVAGKAVILGDASVRVGEGRDLSRVPGHDDVPGVFVVASATQTLLGRRMLCLTDWGRLVLDSLFAGLVICISLFLSFKYSHINESRVSYALAFGQIFVFYAAGLVFVATTRVMWDDFLLAVPAILAGSWFERMVSGSHEST